MKFTEQRTVNNQVSCKGIGLHSGKQIELTIKPAGANMGIIFVRTDVKAEESRIEANFANVVKTTLGTVIANKHGVEVSTIEHLMAALYGCGVDNAIIEVSGPEVPIMDGSSEPFINLIDSVGTKELGAYRKIIRIKDEVKVGDENKWAIIRPSRGFKVKVDIDFSDKAIAHQVAKYDFKENTFRDEIADARTFCMKREVDAMYAAGLAKGGSLDNAIVVHDGKVLNKEGLRYEDEFVRHKILDAVGDLYLIGARIQGEFVGVHSGHKLNNEVLRTLIDSPFAWELVNPVSPSHRQLKAASLVFA
jgi:UDP-3-O-[3-hydroxymyristoyl] N-acetylglucosamine deacetylase